MVDRTGGSNVEDMCGCMKGLYPKIGWKVALNKQCVDNIIRGSEHALGLAILRRGTGAG
jgi:hypothetical protein